MQQQQLPHVNGISSLVKPVDKATTETAVTEKTVTETSSAPTPANPPTLMRPAVVPNGIQQLSPPQTKGGKAAWSIAPHG